jgi:hypothetical protein
MRGTAADNGVRPSSAGNLSNKRMAAMKRQVEEALLTVKFISRFRRQQADLDMNVTSSAPTTSMDRAFHR